MRFVWDSRKAASNFRKHGVSFEEASTVFDDPLAVIVCEAIGNERALIIGQSIAGRVLLNVFVEVAPEVMRLISARRPTTRERRLYEEGEEP